MAIGRNLLTLITALGIGSGVIGCGDNTPAGPVFTSGTYAASHENAATGDLQTILRRFIGTDNVAGRNLYQLVGFNPDNGQVTLAGQDSGENPGITPGTSYRFIDILKDGTLIAERQDFTGGNGGQYDVVAFDLATIVKKQFDKSFDTGTPFQTERFIKKVGNDSFLMSRYNPLTQLSSLQLVTPNNPVGTQISNLVLDQGNLVINPSEGGVLVMEKDTAGNYMAHKLDETTKSLNLHYLFPAGTTSVDSKSTLELVSWNDANFFNAMRFMPGGSRVAWDTTRNVGDSFSVESVAHDGNAQIYSLLNGGNITYHLLDMQPNSPSSRQIGAMPGTFGAFEGTSGGHIGDKIAVIEGSKDGTPNGNRYVVTLDRSSGLVIDELAALYSGASNVTATLGHAYMGNTFVDVQVTPSAGAAPLNQLLYVNGVNGLTLEDIFSGAYDETSVVDTSEDGRYALIRGRKSNADEFVVFDMETSLVRNYLLSVGVSLGDRQTSVAALSKDGNKVAYVTRELITGAWRDVLNVVDITNPNDPTVYPGIATGDAVEPAGFSRERFTGGDSDRVYATVDGQLKLIDPVDGTAKDIKWQN